MMTSVLLVDDHVVVRKGLALLLKQQPTINVVGEADDGRTAVEAAEKLSPDVVVMDVGMPNMGGVEATQLIVKASPKTRVLALSAYSDRQHVLSILSAGASGYVLKGAAAEELVAAVAAVAAGSRYLSPDLSALVLNESLAGSWRGQGNKLTARECEVLKLLAEGSAMKQIAAQLGISTKTVESHRRAMMEKLQLFSVAELTKYSLRNGLTTLDSDRESPEPVAAGRSGNSVWAHQH